MKHTFCSFILGALSVEMPFSFVKGSWSHLTISQTLPACYAMQTAKMSLFPDHIIWFCYALNDSYWVILLCCYSHPAMKKGFYVLLHCFSIK
jgi:hypothetical protein